MSKNSKLLKRVAAIMLAGTMTVSISVPNTLTVSAASKKTVSSIKVAAKKKTLTVGKSATVKVTVKGTKKASKKFTVKSSDKKVATAKVSGKKVKITAKKAGKATITVTTKAKNKKGKKLSKKIVVTVKAGSDVATTTVAGTTTQTAASATTKAGTTTAATATTASDTKTTAGPANTTAAGADKTTASADKTTEAADKTTAGPANTTAAGADKTTASADKTTEAADKTTASTDQTTEAPAETPTTSAEPTTTEAPNSSPVESITIVDGDKEVAVGASIQLTANVLPASANQEVVWTTSEPGVATVDNGKVTGVAEGTTTITAKAVDGQTSSVTITVKKATHFNADGVTMLVANNLEGYDNTVLTGTAADVLLNLSKDGKGVGNTKVTVTLDPLYGHTPSQASIFSFPENKDEIEVTTDENGQVHFSVDLKTDYKKYTATDGYYASYNVTAKVPGSNIEETVTISFGTININGTTVLNNIVDEYNDITPSENALSGDDGIHSTKGYNAAINGTKEVDWEYVKSQQVSGTGVDHRVYISATPVLVLPSTEGAQQIEKYSREFPAESEEYSVYTDSENENTTTVIDNVPAGLQYATLFFDKYDISKYTKMVIACYDAETNAIVQDQDGKDAIYEYTGTDLKESGVQLPVQDDVAINVVISLVSEGQVDDDANTGYSISRIEGVWKSTTKNKYKEVVLDSDVKWEKETITYQTKTGLSYEEVKDYVPATYAEGYTFKTEIPTFPTAAASYITVYDKNDEAVDYYICPSENDLAEKQDSEDDTAVYKNQMVIANEMGIKGGIMEVDQQNVGTFEQVGDILVADSTMAGVDAYVGTITCDLLDDKSLNALNKEVHTSVQWAPLPVEVKRDGTDYYSLSTQNIVVNAILVDKDGVNRVATEDADITYYYKHDFEDGEKDYIEIEPDKNSTFEDGNLTTISAETKTNKYGVAQIIFQAKDGDTILKNLKATSDKYNVKLVVGNYSDEELNVKGEDGTYKLPESAVDIANLHWVDAGLSFTDKVDFYGKDKESTTTTSWGTAENVDLDNRKVGKNWIFGYELIGRTSAKNDEYDAVVDITGVDIDVKKPENATDSFEATTDGVAKMCVEKTGEASLTGSIANKEYGKDVVFVVKDAVTGIVLGTYENIGSNKATVQSSISLNISWENNGEEPSIVFPWGEMLDMNAESTAYVKVVDKYNNPIANREVTYTVGDNGKEQTGTTDENGLIAIELPAPQEETTVNIVATVGNTQKESSIKYVNLDNLSDLALVCATESGQNQIDLTFTNSINPDLLNVKEFVVKKSGDADAIVIKSAEVIEGTENKKVRLTLKDNFKFESTTVYQVSMNSYEENGIEYQLIDENGKLLNEDYTKVSFKTDVEYTFRDDKDLSDGLTVDVLSGGAMSTITGDTDSVYVVASNPALLPESDGTGVLKLEVNGLTVKVAPQSAKGTITVYYKGFSKQFTVNEASEDATEDPADETTETPADETTEAPADETTETPVDETTETEAE